MHHGDHRQYVRVAELIDGGDWACAFGQCGTLRYVCLELAQLVDDPDLARKASMVAEDATRDLDTAARCWGELAEVLRHAPMPRGALAGRGELGAHL